MGLKKEAKIGFFWSALIQLSHQSLGFVVTVILARLLMPEDYGIIGIVVIFISLGKTLLDGGLAASLIRNKEVDQIDYSTIFFANIFISIFLFAILFITAPSIAIFFDMPLLENILRWYGVVFIIGALSIVQSVRLNKKLDFKTQFKLQLVSLIVSASVSIWMAFNGYGVWSLVAKEIIFSSIASLQLWLYSRWVPSFVFDSVKFKYHLNFGYKILLTSILNKLFNDSYKVVIGKFFPVAQLGLYTRARSMQELPSGIIFSTINRVMYPLLANVNDDDGKLKHVYRRIIQTITYFLLPFLTFVGILAKPIFLFLLTEKWIEAVPYFQILILAAFFSPVQAYMLNICKVKGRSDLVLKLAVFEYLLISVGLVTVYWFGIYGLLWSIVAVAHIKTLFTGRMAGRLIKYSFLEQLKDIYQPYIYSVIAAVALITINYLVLYNVTNNLVLLFVGAISFTSVYVLASFVSGNNVFLSSIKYLQFWRK